MFEGHKFVKLILDSWVFDFTEFIGYKVTTGKDTKVNNYRAEFKASLDADDCRNITFEKSESVPVKVLKEAYNIIQNYVAVREVNN